MSHVMKGRVRKSLEQQIDRLDAILDGLAEALNEAVADAVKEAVGVAVKEAVQAALTHALSNPQLVRKVAEAHGIRTEPAKASPVELVTGTVLAGWKRLRSFASAAYARVKGVAVGAWEAVTNRGTDVRHGLGRRVGSVVSMIRDRVHLVVTLLPVVLAVAKLHRKTAIVSTAAGVLAGVGSYLAGSVIASVGCGVAGFVCTLGVAIVSRRRSV